MEMTNVERRGAGAATAEIRAVIAGMMSVIGIEIIITTSVIMAEVGTGIGIGLVIVNAVGVIGTTMIDTGTVIVTGAIAITRLHCIPVIVMMTAVHVGYLLINYLKQLKRD